MNHPTPAFLNWSGGKDAAHALHLLSKDSKTEVKRLLTTVGEKSRRVAMHAVREELIHAQAEAIGIPVDILYLPENPSMNVYESRMLMQMTRYRQEGINTSVFGDINLLDLRKYREDQLNRAGIKGLFPLWDKDTAELARSFVDSGFHAIVVSVNAALLDETFVGIPFDADFLDRLPPTVDPCGENGEFHTFVHDGPQFRTHVAFELNEKVYWEYPADPEKQKSKYDLWQIDLIPGS